MANAYSTWIVEWHGGKTRAYVNAWLESETDKTATIRVQGCCNAWRITQYGRRIRIYGDGKEIGTTTDVVFSRYGAGNFGWIDRRFTVQKGKNGRNVSCSCLIKKEVVNGYGASGKDEQRTASVNVWVGAQVLRPPSKPGKPSVARGKAGVINVSWKNNASNAKKTQLQRMAYGGSWATVLNSSSVVTSYSDSVGAGTFAYRVRYQNDDGYSGWSDVSAFITSLQAPAVPTIVSPLNGDTLDASAGNPTIRFRHNPRDGSEQTGAQLRWKDETASDWTTVTLTTETSVLLEVVTDAVVNKNITWQVRTKGAYDGGGTAENAWSAWSAAATFYIRTAPQITVSVEETVTEVPVTVSWDYEDASGTQAMASIAFYDEGGSLAFSDRYEGAETSVTIAASQFTPAHQQTYTVEVTAVSTTSLQTEGAASFYVDYTPPAVPVFSVMLDPESHSNEVTVYDSLNAVATEHFNVFRDGVLVAETLYDGQSFVDVLPPLDAPITYRVVAYAASGAVAESSQTVRVPSNGFLCINYGDGFQQVAKMRRNLSNPDGIKGEKVVRTVASNDLPKVFYGTHRTREATASADVWAFRDLLGDGDSASLAAFVALENHNGNVRMRFPFGDSILATIDTSHSMDTGSKNWASVSVAWQEVAQ